MCDSDRHADAMRRDRDRSGQPESHAVQGAAILQLLSLTEAEGRHPVELRARLDDLPVDVIAAALLSLERALAFYRDGLDEKEES